MDLALLVARLVLAAVFVTAGIAKLADPQGSRRAAAEFGVPARFAAVVGLALPVAEIMIAAALVPVATARWGAIAALVLLAMFITTISLNLARGRTPDCHCFGQLHSAPAGRQTIVRNSVLTLIASFIVLGGWGDPGYSAVAWLGDLSGVGAALLVVGLVVAGAFSAVAWVLVNLISQNGRILARLEDIEQALGVSAASPTRSQSGLPVGGPAPDFALADTDGRAVTLETLRSANAPVVLVFSDPGCGPCNLMMPDVARWQRELTGRLTLAVVSRGGAEANRMKAREHGLDLILLQKDREVSKAYGTHGTPAAVLIRTDGTIGEPLAEGGEAVRKLIERISGTARAQQPVRAPDFQLPDLSGNMVTLASLQYAGKPVLLLFTHPRCGPCNSLLPEIAEWQREHGDRFTLAVVSAGDVDANREAMDEHEIMPILLQRELEIVNAYGVAQAPAAIVIHPNGHIDGEPAYGEHSIRQLLASMAGRPAYALSSPSVSGRQLTNESPVGIGDRASMMPLPNLEGKQVDLAEFHGVDTTLLFWNPGCGYCQRLVQDVREWERRHANRSQRLMVISTGSLEATRAHGFNSEVLLDHGVGVGRHFGSRGTPAAIRLDAEGRIASPIVSGMIEVQALLRATAGAETTPVSRGDDRSEPLPP